MGDIAQDLEATFKAATEGNGGATIDKAALAKALLESVKAEKAIEVYGLFMEVVHEGGRRNLINIQKLTDIRIHAGEDDGDSSEEDGAYRVMFVTVNNDYYNVRFKDAAERDRYAAAVKKVISTGKRATY